jgi:hypothetical protein
MNEGRDRLIDALLAQHLGESPLRMEQRYARAFAALESPRASAAESRMPARRRALQWARAALIALAAGTLFLLMPDETRAESVLAQVMSGESRARAAETERRYEVTVVLPRRAPGSRERDAELTGHWDMRGDESRLELRDGDGPALIRADSIEGAWEMREGGPVDDLETRELWPRWIEERDGRIAVERMDELLGLIQRSYELAFARGGDESPEHLRGALHLVAARRVRARGPNEVDLWIDTERNVVLEARMRWSPEEGASGAPGRGPRGMMGGGPGPRLGAGPAGGPGGPPGMRPGRPAEHDHPAPPRPTRGEGRDRMPPSGGEDYRAVPGALPTFPPVELRLRRIEPISFPVDHFARPQSSATAG